MNIFKKYRLAKTPVFELNPNRKYLIGLDKNNFSMEDASTLSVYLKKKLNIPNVVALFDGDPNKAIKIIKQRKGKL